MLPVLLVVLAAAVWALSCVSAQLACTDAAALAARAAARGDAPAEVRSAAQAAAPPGAVVDVRLDDQWVRVTVRARVAPPGPLSRAGGLQVSGSAVALREDVSPSAVDVATGFAAAAVPAG